MSTTSAVIFDFGGVLTSEPNRAAVIQFVCDSFQISESEFESINRDKCEDIEEFWIQYCKDKGRPLPPFWGQQFQTALRNAIRVNFEVFTLVDELKENQIKVGLLSNIDKKRAKYIREFGLYNAFDPCLLSYEIGIEKPNLKAYEILIGCFSCHPKEIVFIDDKEENVKGAKRAGLDAIHFQSAKQLRSELIKRGAIPLLKKGTAP